jgi:hypothetical protein
VSLRDSLQDLTEDGGHHEADEAHRRLGDLVGLAIVQRVEIAPLLPCVATPPARRWVAAASRGSAHTHNEAADEPSATTRGLAESQATEGAHARSTSPSA